MTLTDLESVFNSGGGFGDKVTDFDGYSVVMLGLFSDFVPFGQRQDAAVKSLLFGFH